ncbi:galactose mutarotase [Postechiella marina]|uniref:Aldose 1-epimerase n=1 Tax=Postechiella marina TaxID=943941 RepID=A0ABP8CCF3_9FLAO
MHKVVKVFAISFLCLFFSCKDTKKTTVSNTFQAEKWGHINGKQIYLYTLTNANGMVLKMTNYGGIITSLLVPDQFGKVEDVVLGFDNLKQYLEPNPCFGATIGRVANRIRNSQFKIDSIVYNLESNSKHCSHGNNEFDRAVWHSEKIENEEGEGIKFHYLSKDGTYGFPGNLDVYVTYTLTKNNAVHVIFEATTDKNTHVNLTQHSYFNLAGTQAKIYDHLIKIDADNYTEIDEDIVPTGIIASVNGHDWDLTKSTRIGKNIKKLNNGGYHYNYVFNNYDTKLKKLIEVIEPKSGRTMDVYTTQPGVQFYSGNAIDSMLVGKYGVKYGPHSGFCLETQHFPNSPNHSNFPSTLLKPGEKYKEEVIYDFGLVKHY